MIGQKHAESHQHVHAMTCARVCVHAHTHVHTHTKNKGQLEQLLASILWTIKRLVHEKSSLLFRQWTYPRPGILKAATPEVKPPHSKDGAEVYLNILTIG